MNFTKHYDIKAKHAFLSPSYYHWLNYSDEKLLDRWSKQAAVDYGNKMHELANLAIQVKKRMPKSRSTFDLYVNDAISFNMVPEQILYYSENCFGTADAISFEKGVLRIHDLKTGETPAAMEQLYIYAAIFCLEYDQDPESIKIELRLYQGENVLVEVPEAGLISSVMATIVRFDRIVTNAKKDYYD